MCTAAKTRGMLHGCMIESATRELWIICSILDTHLMKSCVICAAARAPHGGDFLIGYNISWQFQLKC
jgi:hypothetical protein